MSQHKNSNNELAIFYQGQLNKFRKLGIGNKTEFKVTVTSRLIDSTEKRLVELKKRTDNYFNRAVPKIRK